MSRFHSKKCSKCGRVGHRFRGDRWLCVIHHRMDTMRATAKAKGKSVPSWAELDALFTDLILRSLRCEVCDLAMRWAGRRGALDTVTLQHDRSGRVRLICMLCNQRHDDLPGDSFYELPPRSWRCSRCETVKPLTEFYKNRTGGVCKACRKIVNKAMWAKFGRIWTANSQRRRNATHRVRSV